MTQKFEITTKEGSFVTLEYDDVKTKKLVGFCENAPVKWLSTTGFIVLVIFGLVFIYDFFKDIGRQVSSMKDLFNGKEGGLSKYMGFTKGNMTRLIVKIVLFLLSLLLFYLSNAMGTKVCFTKKDIFMLERIQNFIKYNDKGEPVELVTP